MKSKKAKLQESVDILRKQVEAGMINVGNNQDLSALSVAMEKEKTVYELEQALEDLEREHKPLQMNVYL